MVILDIPIKAAPSSASGLQCSWMKQLQSLVVDQWVYVATISIQATVRILHTIDQQIDYSGLEWFGELIESSGLRKSLPSWWAAVVVEYDSRKSVTLASIRECSQELYKSPQW